MDKIRQQAPDSIWETNFSNSDNPYPQVFTASAKDLAEDEDHFRRIRAVMQTAADMDFGLYRDTTIRRRIVGRMALRTQDSLADYARLLATDQTEIKALYRDMLIDATNFFRDPTMFETLKSTVFP